MDGTQARVLEKPPRAIALRLLSLLIPVRMVKLWLVSRLNVRQRTNPQNTLRLRLNAWIGRRRFRDLKARV